MADQTALQRINAELTRLQTFMQKFSEAAKAENPSAMEIGGHARVIVMAAEGIAVAAREIAVACSVKEQHDHAVENHSQSVENFKAAITGRPAVNLKNAKKLQANKQPSKIVEKNNSKTEDLFKSVSEEKFLALERPSTEAIDAALAQGKANMDAAVALKKHQVLLTSDLKTTTTSENTETK